MKETGVNLEGLDEVQRASAEQFQRQSGNYGKSHILADTSDVARALDLIEFAPASAALDVATGGGHTALYLARRGFDVHIGDISDAMLENARSLIREEGLDARPFRFAAESMPFDDASFELVTSRVAPHHFSSPEKFLSETVRVLRPGGWFLLIDGSVPDDSPETEVWSHQVEKWRDPSHHRFLSRKSWEELVGQCGLEVVTSYLEPLKMPDLEWYFKTAGTSPENRARVLEAVSTAPDKVRQAMRLGTEGDRIVWWWQRLTLLARKPD